MPQYVNIRIFLSSNQILREINFGHFEAPITCRLDHFCSSEFWIFGNVWHFQVGNFQNSKPTKLLKLANIDFRVAGIILFTLLVHKKFDNYFVKWSQCSKYKQAFENCNRYMYIGTFVQCENCRIKLCLVWGKKSLFGFATLYQPLSFRILW